MFKKAAEHSVQPTNGILRVFWQFSTPQQDSVFEPRPRPIHLRLTQTVGRLIIGEYVNEATCAIIMTRDALRAQTTNRAWCKELEGQNGCF
jgi:hypothetical protein